MLNIFPIVRERPVIPPTVKLFGLNMHTIENACIKQPMYTTM